MTLFRSPSSPRPLAPPASLGRRRYFPGWTMIGISAAAQFMSGPGQSYGVAAFSGPMRASLGVSETGFSLAYAVATLASGLLLPWTGRQIDRFGARRVLPLVAALLGLACGVMSQVQNLPSLYLGLTLIRCLGQGALTLVATWIVGEWFLRRRGFATALAGLGSSLSVVAFPLLNHYLIAWFGWNHAWSILGVIAAAALVGPSIVWLRDRPEDLGLSPDGDEPHTEETRVSSATVAGGGASPTHESWTLAEVLRDATFWKLLSVPVASGMIGTGMILHQVSLLGSRGVSASVALGLISLQAGIATLAALGAGWLTDRRRSEHMLAAAMFLLAAAVFTMLVMNSPSWAVLYAALMGLHGSIIRSAGTVVWINYYGRQNQGAIRGIAMSAMILAAAVGPLPLALAVDQLGGYQAALLLFIVVPLAAGCLVLTASRPTRAANHE